MKIVVQRSGDVGAHAEEKSLAQGKEAAASHEIPAQGQKTIHAGKDHNLAPVSFEHKREDQESDNRQDPWEKKVQRIPFGSNDEDRIGSRFDPSVQPFPAVLNRCLDQAKPFLPVP